MMPFIDCNEIIFRGTFFLLLLAALISLISFAICVAYQLKLRYVFLELGWLLVASIFFCLLSDGIQIRDLGRSKTDFAGSLCFLPTWCILAITLIILILVCLSLGSIIKKRISSLTAMSIKEAISILPVGLCFYDETGRLLLTNDQMVNECFEITGKPLLDGAAFWKALQKIKANTENDSVILDKKGEKASCYKQIIHDIDGKAIYEITASDISQEFALKKRFETQNEELRKMNVRLRKYGETVTEVTKEKEILAARIKVHDGMGSLILKTKRALSQEESNVDNLINEWNEVVSLISTSELDEDCFEEIEKTGRNIGVKPIYQGVYPVKRTKAEQIIVKAILEGLTNTARHADGDELYISVKEINQFYQVEITNNGNQPKEEIIEGGGLSALRTMVEMMGGTMKINILPRFILTLFIPKGEKENER